MKNELLIILFLLCGCGQRISYMETKGTVSYDGSLSQALEECTELCGEPRDFYEGGYHKVFTPTPQLDNCDEDECVCLC